MSFTDEQRTRFKVYALRLLLLVSVTLILTLLLASCASPRHAEQALTPPDPYTRIERPDSNTLQLQIAVRKFLPAHRREPAVWLVGACHVGEPGYYQSLQDQLDAQTLVLYEGVNAEAHSRRVRGHPGAGSAPAAPSHTNHPPLSPSLQSTMASSLGLVFQLDAIDYDRTNFLNSDLSLQQIQQLIYGAGPSANPSTNNTGNSSFQYLMQAMDGSSLLGSLMRIGMQFVGSDSHLQAITRLIFIEALGRLKGDLASVHGMPPDMQQLLKVLIEARNQTVIEDLKSESRHLPPAATVAIFYGTGHMDDLERRLTSQLHYRPAGEVWFTAFSVDIRQTGLSGGEVQMVQNLVKWQMDQLQ